jgi:inorganic pyrophosphatase
VIIAMIHRYDDVEEKWVVAKEGSHFNRQEICEATHFQEQFYHIDIRCE